MLRTNLLSRLLFGKFRAGHVAYSRILYRCCQVHNAFRTHTFSWAMLPSVTTLHYSVTPPCDSVMLELQVFWDVALCCRVNGSRNFKAPPSNRREPLTRRHSVQSQMPWNFEHNGFRNDHLHPPLQQAVAISQVRSKFIRNVNHYSSRCTVSRVGSWPSSTIYTNGSANSNSVGTYIY